MRLLKTKRAALIATSFLCVAGAACAQLTPTPQAEASDVSQSPLWKQAVEPQYFLPAGVEAVTQGGKGGKIIKVTSLDNEGPGTLRAALEAKGPRIVVFEVAGVIDLDRKSIGITDPYLTIAGQTAPSPGVTLIEGGLVVATHDVIIQHIRIRPGDGLTTDKWDADAISTRSASNVIVDHCSLTWATDENMSASGPRFTGATPDEWRDGASHDLLYSHNLAAEGLANSTHPKFEHSKGSLIHDNTSNITLFGNVYAHNMERSPLFKGGVRGAIVNNLIYNPGQRAIHYNLQGLEWGDAEFQTGKMDIIGNVMRGGPSTNDNLPMVLVGGDGPVELFLNDNISVDKFGAPLPEVGRYTMGTAEIVSVESAAQDLNGLEPMSSKLVERYVLASAGARPWDRDKHDVRVMADVAEGRGKIIDSQEEVGGYPVVEPVKRKFDPDLWNLDTMTPKTTAALDDGSASKGT